MLALSSSRRSCWLTLLCYASQTGGTVKFLDEDSLIEQSGISVTSDEYEITKGVLKQFEKLDMIRVDNGVITVLNWGKRQQSSLTPYERVKRYRDKKRNDNANDNGREDKIREDKIREDKNIQSSNTSVAVKEELNPLLECFKGVNPSYERLYPNRTQRAALARLVKKWGAEKVRGMIESLPGIVGRPYAPKITTPVELERDLGKIKQFLEQESKKGVEKNASKFIFT